MRLFRLLKIVRLLYELAQSITEALQGMFWMLVFMIVTLYSVAILCTRVIGHGNIIGEDADEDLQKIKEMFSSVSTSMFTLFGTVSSWSLMKFVPLFEETRHRDWMHCEDANASAALCGLGVKKDCYCVCSVPDSRPGVRTSRTTLRSLCFQGLQISQGTQLTLPCSIPVADCPKQQAVEFENLAKTYLFKAQPLSGGNACPVDFKYCHLGPSRVLK